MSLLISETSLFSQKLDRKPRREPRRENGKDEQRGTESVESRGDKRGACAQGEETDILGLTAFV